MKKLLILGATDGDVASLQELLPKDEYEVITETSYLEELSSLQLILSDNNRTSSIAEVARQCQKIDKVRKQIVVVGSGFGYPTSMVAELIAESNAIIIHAHPEMHMLHACVIDKSMHEKTPRHKNFGATLNLKSFNTNVRQRVRSLNNLKPRSNC